MRRASFVALAAGLALLPLHARGGGDTFDALVTEYYAGFPAAHPSAATDLGLHEKDDDLEDFYEAGVARERARLESFRKRFGALDTAGLSAASAADLTFVKSAIDASLLELEKVQSYRHRADFYTGLANQSIYVLVKRAFAPEAKRLEAVCAREEKIPGLLAAAKKNLTGVPKVNVAIALEELPGVADFFKDDVPRAFPAALENEALAARFKKANEAVLAAFEDYRAFVETLAKDAHETFAIGEDLFRAKLRTEEMIETPLDELLARGDAELARLQAEFKRTAARIDPKQTPAEVQLEITKDHAAPDQVLAETQARLLAIRKFLVEHAIVTIPSEVMPKVEATPSFMRATTLASMFTPGPFETVATEAIYNVTLPEASWPAEKVEDYLRGALSRPVMDVTSIHEAFPGHYVQFLWLPKVASRVRKFEGAASNSEGWAHYCEQMLLDEGFGADDPKLRLAQLQDALLRAARYVVGIRMHARGLSLEAAIDFFEKQGYQSKEVALMEARRGTEDPTYLYYTWGKLEILKLRDDHRKKLGASWSLRKFHDAFLAEGAAPLSLVRKALLGDAP